MSERATLTGILFVLKPGIPWQMLVSRDGLQSAKTTEVGGKQRGYDGGKKVHGRKRQLLLVDTEGLTLKAKIHSAKVPDQDGLRLLLKSAGEELLPRLKHLWVDAGYEGSGKRWAEEALGLSVEVVRRTRKPVPEKVARL